MKKGKFLCLIMAVIMMLSLLAGCKNSEPSGEKSSSSSSSSTSVSSSQTTENKEVKMLTNVTGGKDEEEMKLFAKALSEATGLNITIDKPASDYGKVLMQKLQSGEKYDLIYITMSDVPNLVEQGAILDITEKVKNSPILGDTNNIPQSEWDEIMIDGKIYAGFNKKEVHRVVNINKVIAQKAGVDVNNIEPTLDGYYEVFKKMKESSSDSTFYPFNVVLSSAFDLQPWFASVGLKGGIVMKDGKKTVPWSGDEAAPVLEWLRKLYAEGLMDKDALTDTTKELRNKYQSGKTGVVTDWAAWVGLYNANAGDKYPNEFESVPLPGAKTPDGNYMLTRGSASLWAVPANAPNVDGAIKVLEYFATQEGGELLSVGIKGHDYNVENNKYVLTDIGKQHACDHGAPVPISSKFKHPIGWNPGFEDAMEYLKYATSELQIAETSKYTEIFSKHLVKIVKGDVSVSQGLNDMRAELKQAGVID